MQVNPGNDIFHFPFYIFHSFRFPPEFNPLRLEYTFNYNYFERGIYLMKKMNKKGFTLIEMLAVIAIIAVLVAIIVPAVGSSTTKAKAAANAANLRSAAASISIEYVDGKLTVADDGKVTGYSIDAPEMKAVTGITGGDFTVVLADNEIVCSFGTDGTIANYADVAEDGKLGE